MKHGLSNNRKYLHPPVLSFPHNRTRRRTHSPSLLGVDVSDDLVPLVDQRHELLEEQLLPLLLSGRLLPVCTTDSSGSFYTKAHTIMHNKKRSRDFQQLVKYLPAATWCCIGCENWVLFSPLFCGCVCNNKSTTQGRIFTKLGVNTTWAGISR